MSVDKLVDSSQLDADLTSVANAIRAKSGGSSQLAFPAGFVSAVQAIPTGGTPTGTKQISITQNGTTTEDVANYANAEITVNVPTGGGKYNPYGLPSGYTALKYLKATGTQWIKTDIAPTLETTIQATGQRTVTSGYTALMGCSNPNVFIPMANGVNATRYYARFGSSSEKNIDNPFPVGTALPPVITISKTQAVFSTEGMADKTVAIGATAIGTINQNTRIALFGRYDGSSNTCATTSGILLRAKIWDDGTLVGDFVPAKRDADDVLGMYDLVSNSFYTNAGTGTFIGGEFE